MSEINQETNQTPQTEGENNQNNQTPPPVQTPPTSTYTSMYDQQSSYSNMEQPPKPANSLTMAIVATVLNIFACCGMYVGILGFILGIVAIVFSTQVDSKYKVGDYDGAESAAKNAKLLSMISLGVAAVGIIIVIIFMIIGGGSAFMQEFNRQMELQGR